MPKHKKEPLTPTARDVWVKYGDYFVYYIGRVECASHCPGWFKLEGEDGYVNLSDAFDFRGEPFVQSQMAEQLVEQLPEPGEYVPVEKPPRDPTADEYRPKVTHQAMRNRAIKAATSLFLNVYGLKTELLLEFTHVLTKAVDAWTFEVGFAVGPQEKAQHKKVLAKVFIGGSVEIELELPEGLRSDNV